VLEDFLPEDVVDSFEDQVANLQLAYAKAVKEEAGGAADG
jgi:hypothetical protein